MKIALGARLPWFRLEDLDGITRSPNDLQPGQVAVVAFICNHSPYVLHIEQQMATLLNDASDKGVYVIAFSPNDVRSYPSDDLDSMRGQAERADFRFPYCLDGLQEAAKAFQANCTPEFFVYDGGSRLIYHGEFDSSRPGSTEPEPVTGRALAHAISVALTGDVLAVEQRSSLGCSVKWRSGNQPDYILTIPDQAWIMAFG